MAFSLNRSQIIGNVTREAEVRMAGTQKVASFSVATNFVWMDKATGQKKEKAEFHNVVAWGKLAEICEKYVRKGSKIYVEGRMQTRDWEGEDGVKRYRTEIVAENVILLGAKGAGEGGAGMESSSSFESRAPRAPRAVRSPAKDQDEVSEPVTEQEVSIDDLPF